MVVLAALIEKYNHMALMNEVTIYQEDGGVLGWIICYRQQQRKKTDIGALATLSCWAYNAHLELMAIYD